MFSLFKKRIVDESRKEQKDEIINFYQRLNLSIELQEGCEKISGGFGEFGIESSNPIPVNGPFGELKYLHRLRCKCNEVLFFHRVGAIDVEGIKGSVDVYETVCSKGVHWELFYFHMYHPYRSSLIPEGYTFSQFHPKFSRIPVVTGTNKYIEAFPNGLEKNIETFLEPFGEPLIRVVLENYHNSLKAFSNNFVRPLAQKTKMESLDIASSLN